MAFGGEKGSGLVLASRLVYDPTAEPVLKPAGPVAFTFVNPPPDGVRSRKRPSPILASSFVFAIPVDDFGWQVHDQPTLRKKRKVQSDNPTPLFPPTAPPTISSTLTSADSGTTAISSRMIYDPTTGPVLRPSAVAPTSVLCGVTGGNTVLPSRMVYDPTAAPIVGSAAVVATPSVYGYQPGEDQRKRKPRLLLESIERALGPSAAGTAATAFGYQAADCPRGKPVRRVSEAFATFVTPPAVIPTPPNPVEPPHGRFLKNEIRRITSLQRG